MKRSTEDFLVEIGTEELPPRALGELSAAFADGIVKGFASARLDMELKDRFGSQVEPREWFLLPLNAVSERGIP